ncbi:MAG: GNAT family N-acetyltransferase [Verrucomicrobiales bacterium]|nr:GNAT family N-acetyltransferase [Verrucomicrobiales bacterium]
MENRPLDVSGGVPGAGDDVLLPEGYVLRLAAASDGAAVRALVFGILQEYGLRPDPNGVDADLSDVNRHYFALGGWFAVLTDPRGIVVGTAGLHPVAPGVVELRKMYLSKEHRGRGLGRALLLQSMAEARRRGFRRMTLETASVLREAVALYQRHGFVVRPGNPCVCRCDMVMERELD